MSPLERRAKERQRKAREKRQAAGTAATHSARGRSAEHSSGNQRIDYTPKIPNERPSTIQIGTTRAQDDAAKRKAKTKKPKTKVIKPNYGSGNYLEKAKITKIN